jgi:phasin family protein
MYGFISPNSAEVNWRAFELAQESVGAAFKLAHDVLRAKSIAEVFAIQAAYARNRFEAQVAFARQIADLSSKFAAGAVRLG